MIKKELRFRQIHLDFHTSGAIPDVGTEFNRREWQEILTVGRVDSVTCFATCHHGWAYYPTRVGQMHPHLKFNLLRAQMDACREIDVRTPVYLTVGYNTLMSELHPEWLEVIPEQRSKEEFFRPGFRKLCFNSPYIDHICDMLKEVVAEFPDADGIFLDIIRQGPCCCQFCINSMTAAGLDPVSAADRQLHADRVLAAYYRRTVEAIHSVDPEMPVFHNSGHVGIGCRDILPYFSHLELESLPTGGWGYDHFPMSAAYARNLGLDFLGMTGKFHRSWGEFGGFKHPNALRYECAAMLANNAKCSIGDQLHPSGRLDRSTYEIIGAAYREVEACEPWCRGAESAAAIAVLATPGRDRLAAHNTGACRFLLENHLPFDFVDDTMDCSSYGVLIVADDAPMTPAARSRVEAFIAAGKPVVLSGRAALDPEGRPLAALAAAAEFAGESEFAPDYVAAAEPFAGLVRTPFLMQLASQRIRVKQGESLGAVHYPYFNRSFTHYCSHQHTPFRPESSGYDAGVIAGNVLYFAHPVFRIYHASGAVMHRDFMTRALLALLGNRRQVSTSGLPSSGRVTLMRQPEEHRYVLHVLYAPTAVRGAGAEMPNFQRSGTVEVIEDLVPLVSTGYEVIIPEPVAAVRLQPEGRELPFEQRDGRLRFQIDSFTCHAMVEIVCG